jgi:hypothetical protein
MVPRSWREVTTWLAGKTQVADRWRLAATKPGVHETPAVVNTWVRVTALPDACEFDGTIEAPTGSPLGSGARRLEAERRRRVGLKTRARI